MKEIPLKLLLKAVTAKRLVNAGLSFSSLVISAMRKRTVIWGKPLILTVEPTNLCNLRCPLCTTGNGQMLRPAGQLDFLTYQKIIDELGDYIFYLLLYQQGEPFLNKEFLRFAEYAKTKRIFVTTSTNGHYLNPETARRIVVSGLDSIIVSIDGADQQSYEIYRVGGHLAKVVAGVENLVRERGRQNSKTPVIFIQFIMMKHNEHQLAEMVKLTKETGADKLLVKTVQVENADEALRWLPANQRLRRYHFNGKEIRPKRVAPGPCPRPWISTLVNWDGSVVPCCFDKNGRHQFGTIKEHHLDHIWNSENYDNFRNAMLTARSSLEICANCSQGLRLYL